MRKMFVFVFAIMLIAGLMGIYSHQEASAQSNASCQISFETKLESDGWLRITASGSWQGARIGDYFTVEYNGIEKASHQTMTESGQFTGSPDWYSNEEHEFVAYINVVNEKTQCDSKTVYPVSAGIDPGVGGAAAPQGPDHGAGGASLWCIFVDGIGQLSAETIAADTRFKWRTPAEGGYLEFSNVWNAPWGTGPDGVARREVPVPSWENPVGTVFMYGTVCYYEPLAEQSEPELVQVAVQQTVADPTPVPTELEEGAKLVSPNGAKSLFQKGNEIWIQTNGSEFDSALRGTAISWEPNWVVIFTNQDGEKCRGDQMGNIYSCEAVSDTNA